MPEKISIITDEVSQDLTECQAFLEAHDLHAVELRCVGGRRVPDLAPADLDVLRGWAREGSPTLLAVSPGLFKCDRDDRKEIERHQRDILPRSLDLARALGAPFLIAFSFENPSGRPHDSAVVDALGATADACVAAGVTLLMENEPGYVASTPDEILALVRAVDHPALLVNWDPLNANVFDTEDLSTGLGKIFAHVGHVHVKNGRLAPGEILARCTSLRDGAIDWPAHLTKLAWLGYDGYLGVETHFEPVRENSAIVLRELRAMAADAGFAWSGD